jgi:signal transduction histidine kinase
VRRRTGARLTIRARLTLVYGGLFLLAGVLILGVTYALVAHQLPGTAQVVSGSEQQVVVVPPPPVSGQPPAPAAGDAGALPSMEKFAGQVRDSALSSLLTRGAIAVAAIGAAAIAAGWLVAGRLLQPLHRMTETAQRIAYAPAADHGLRERIGLAGPRGDDVKHLADTFDVMLERLDRSFDGQRRFIANVSHELRTPLTLSRTLLEVALDPDAPPPDLPELGGTLLDINSRHERLIDGLLLLARCDRDALDRSYVDLSDIVEHVTAELPSGPVAVDAQPGEAPTTGDPVLLERLVQNLIENGIRHNIPEHGWVHVTTCTRPDDTVHLQVGNSGPVVPRDEIPSLFEPFHRLHADRVARSTGNGLGLSIVQAITHAHGGHVHAEPRNDGGLVVTVTLPAAT